jgi:hypothetical protein
MKWISINSKKTSDQIKLRLKIKYGFFNFMTRKEPHF